MEKEERKLTLAEVYASFLENVNAATSFLDLAGSKELRMEIRSLKPLTRMRDKYGPFRALIKEYTDKMYVVGLPITVVFSVSCFEVFLKDSFEAMARRPLLEGDHSGFPNLDEARKRFGGALKADCLRGDNALQSRAKAILQKRNVIVHMAGRVDQKANDAFMAAGKPTLEEGANLVLTVHGVKEDVETLKLNAVRLVEAANLSQNSSSKLA